MLQLLIIDKTGTINQKKVRNMKEDEIYKKCGFKDNDNFAERACWKVKIDGDTHTVKCFARDEGRASTENKYDLPPPIDTKLYFGSMVLINTDGDTYKDLTLDLWDKIYEKLFGGFEDLSATAQEDEKEADELENVPKEMKTKDGYLKDGFVVDSNSDDGDDDGDDDDDDDDESWNDDYSELEYEEYQFTDDD
ncbi:MAG: hypothetical protein CMF80_06040 [Candidatus Marinimicrobia bacterium]|nr:hypothetical protein [Candidatus Neomarinimicrobiota bacterium]|tara:strand:- start:2752 stop:3330 length:579 start_codon:yes stop_codon:yes gene_type:complete